MPTSFTVVEQLYLDTEGANDLGWQTDAACRGENTNAFFADGRINPVVVETCTACPVIDQCRAYAVDRDWIYGIWGGTTKAERDRIRAAGTTTRVPDRCGRGHVLDEATTYLVPGGGWRCRKCAVITRRARQERRAAA